MNIRGEYWIIDGRADFADGDNSDKNHEMIAIEHICSLHLDKIYNYAQKLSIENLPSLMSIEVENDDQFTHNVQSLLKLISRKLFQQTDPNDPNRPLYKSDTQIWAEIEKNCGLDNEALHIMMSGDQSLHRYSRATNSSLDPRVYVMRTEGWITVRNNNIELYGLDQKKLKELSSGLDDIIDQETGWAGANHEEINDENIEFNLFDVKTNKSIDITLKDIKEKSVFRPQRIPQTTYNRPLPALTGKQYGRELWRGTSESFKAFFESTVILYRGDPEKYKTHSLSKGDINALFGQGIYLTSNKRIAGDYTVKGDQDTLFRGSGYKTKQKIIDAYIRTKALNFDENGKETYYQTALPSLATDPVRIKRLEYSRQHWEQIKKDYEVRINVDGTSVIRKKDSGHVSTYEIPVELTKSVYDTDEEVEDNVLNALCVAMRSINAPCNEIYQLAKEDEDGFKPSFRTIWREMVDGGWGVINDQKFQTAFRREMKALGYKGLIYSGGVTMGGGIQHRAYVFWDEQGLAKYRKE